MGDDIRFKLQSLIMAIDKRPRPSSYFLDNWFPGFDQQYVTYLVVEELRGDRKIAPMVRKGSEAIVVDPSDRGIKDVVDVPEMRMKMKYDTNKEAEIRQQMQNLFLLPGQRPPDPRNVLIAKYLQEMKNKITWRDEWLCAKLLQGGILQYHANGMDWYLDCLMGAHTFALANSGDPLDITWDDPTAPIPAQLSAWNLADMDDADGESGSLITLGLEAYYGFISNNAVLAECNRYKTVLGTVDLTKPPANWTIRVADNFMGFKIDCYFGKYKDDVTNTEDYYLNPKSIIMGAPNANFNIKHYCSIPDEDLPEGSIPVEIFSKSWVEKDPSARWILTASRMLPWLHWPEKITHCQVIEDT